MEQNVVLKHLPLIDISLQNFSGWGRMKSAQDLLDLFMFAFLEHSWSIKIERVEVPRHPVVGGRADLVCPYILETDRKGQTESLYSVKWYKDGHEFYRQVSLIKNLSIHYQNLSLFRYVPKDKPRSQVFNVAWITVDVSSFLYTSGGN